jgi:CHASE2 domain-containing sensor protein
MDYLVVINFGQGTWQDGFPTVIAQLWESGRSTPMQFTGSLPAIPQLVDRYQRWRSLYNALYVHLGWRRFETDHPEFELEDEDPTHISAAEFHQLSHDLQTQLNTWLNASSFRVIDRQLRTRLSPKDSIRIMVIAKDTQVLQLPWCLWDFLVDYPKAEVALSLPEFARSMQIPNSNRRKKVRILSVLGNAQGIDVERDRQLLQSLPSTEIHFLVEPTAQTLQEKLWQSQWDVLFFAGHSSTDNSTNVKGYIQISQNETLTIEQLKYGLRHAIAEGLKLAIFNSCDGLGLAQNLADLQLPQVIVMRESVPDRIAQDFLKAFLAAFSGGKSLYAAVREAREKLQALETEFPCATWLPVICQNPAEVPPTWQDWCGPKRQLLPSMTRSQAQTIALSTLLITSLITGIRWLGLMQPLELQAFDALMQRRPIEQADPRLLIVRIDEEDIQKQPQNAGSLSDETLDRILTVLDQHQAQVVGLDLYRDFPTQRPSLKKRFEQMANDDRLIAICKRPDPQSNDPTGIAPPPGISESEIGFSDFLQDQDGVVRRQLLFTSPNTISACTTPYSLGVQLVFRYLVAQNSSLAPTFTAENHLQLGKTIFPALKSQTSGYQRFDSRGSQVLLNYRSTNSPLDVAQQVTVRQLLSGSMNLDAIKGRIVLIGVTAPSSGDYFSTSYGKGFPQQLPGVIVHAHMVSQLLSAVLDQRSLLWVWTPNLEILWIGGWTLLGGLMMWRFHHFRGIAIAMAGSVLLLVGSCWLVLTQAGWIPLVPALLGLVMNGSVVAYRFLSDRVHLTAESVKS